MRSLILILFLFLAAATAWAAPAQVLMIRHAEKPTTGNDLSPQGYLRAQALVNYFKTSADVTQYGTPVAIYAMGPSSADSSNRAVETVTPLAQSLGLKIQDQYKKNDVQALVTEILSSPQYDGKMVLICWEHKVIADIAVQFGVDPAPEAWPGDDFSTVYELDFSNGALSKFTTFSEKVSVPASSTN